MENGKKTKSKIIFFGSDFLSKKVHVMFLRVLQVFFGVFSAHCLSRAPNARAWVYFQLLYFQRLYFHVAYRFFGCVRQRVSRTTSIIDMRDGLTEWFLE